MPRGVSFISRSLVTTPWQVQRRLENFEALLSSTAGGYGASLVGIEDAGGLLTATTVEAAVAEVATTAQGALPLASDLITSAVIAVANATGGATGAALTLQLTQLAGDPVGSAREVLIICKDSADTYRPFINPPAISSVTFGAATVGSIVASGGGWCLARTSAAGAFACTASNNDDETIVFAVVTPEGISALQYKCMVAACVPDSATWSA